MSEDGGDIRVVRVPGSGGTQMGFFQIFFLGLAVTGLFLGIFATIVGIGATLWIRFRWKGLIPFLIVIGFYQYQGILLQSVALMIVFSIPFWIVRLISVTFTDDKRLWPW